MTMDFIDRLIHTLKKPLPGNEAQRIMSPEGRRNFNPDDNYRQAAVLICLFRNDNGHCFPLIHRVKDEYAHSNQIALPGGKIDSGESAEDAALREAEEEIGLDRNSIEVVGKLTQLPIPISKFIVHPFVGVVYGVVEWRLNQAEVQSLLEIPIEWLLDHELVHNEIWTLTGKQGNVPFFHFNGMKVWGATAMILSEFKQLILSIEVPLTAR